MESEFNQNGSRTELMLHTTSNLKQDSEEINMEQANPDQWESRQRWKCSSSFLCYASLYLFLSVCVFSNNSLPCFLINPPYISVFPFLYYQCLSVCVSMCVCVCIFCSLFPDLLLLFFPLNWWKSSFYKPQIIPLTACLDHQNTFPCAAPFQFPLS